MPISCNPNDTVPVVLRTDEARAAKAKADGQDPGPLPTFHVRFHTEQEAQELRKLLRQAEEAAAAERDEEARDLLSRLIADGAARWQGVADRAGCVLAPAANPAHTFLTGTELWELAYATVRRPELAEEDLRNFVPPSVGSGASSAPATTAPTA